MARAKGQGPVQESVLDRLMNPVADYGKAGSADKSLSRLKEAVLRDIEWLLNTRQTPDPAPDERPELQRSVFNFGLPDLHGLGLDYDSGRKLVGQVERSLRLFEPRLDSLKVSLMESASEHRRVHLVIEGLLRLEPEKEPVAFDTVLDVGTGAVDVDHA